MEKSVRIKINEREKEGEIINRRRERLKERRRVIKRNRVQENKRDEDV